MVKAMISDEELMQKIDEVSGEFHGQIDDLYEAVGMLVVGRLYGWEVMRMCSSRRTWTTATKVFGDPKELLPRRGRFAYRSFGLKMADAVGSVMDVVKGKIHLPAADRKMLT